MTGIIIAIAVIAVLAVVYWMIRPHKRIIQKNLSSQTNNRIRAILIIAAILVVFFVLRAVLLSFRQSGESSLPGEAGSKAVHVSEEADEAQVVITVRGEKVQIDGEAVSDASIRERLSKVQQSGQSVLLVDDYAKAETYLAVRDLLLEFAVPADRLEERKEP